MNDNSFYQNIGGSITGNGSGNGNGNGNGNNNGNGDNNNNNNNGYAYAKGDETPIGYFPRRNEDLTWLLDSEDERRNEEVINGIQDTHRMFIHFVK